MNFFFFPQFGKNPEEGDAHETREKEIFKHGKVSLATVWRRLQKDKNVSNLSSLEIFLTRNGNFLRSNYFALQF